MSAVVLVTGGAGYIGSHVCKELSQEGITPICYDTLEKGHDWAVRWGPLERGDIGDRERLDEVFHRYRPRGIIHLAGYIEVGESVREPERYMQNNVAKSDVLIEAALAHEVEAFVFSSSCAVYGFPQSELLSESHPIQPLSPYAESKARVENALHLSAARGLRSAALRYFNASGADPEGQIGEAHSPETHLLPLAVDAALGLGAPLTVLGDDYPTPDGSCIRDFIHVSDLATGHVRVLKWLQRSSARGLHESFNLGSGIGYSVREALTQMARIAGAVPHNVGPRRVGDSPRLVGDIAKSKLELGWTPTRDLATQIEDTLRWRRKMPR
jgi:UDP-glucose-4-epimerase GalE